MMGIFDPPKPNLLLGSLANGFPLWPRRVRLGPKEIASHKRVIGISGTGKSYGIVSWYLNLLSQGIAVTSLDPHSEANDVILEQLAARGYFRRPDAFDRLWYIEFREDDYFVPFNILKANGLPHTIAGNFKEAIHRAWPQTAFGAAPMMDTLLQDGVKVLISNGLPITSLYNLLSDKESRDHLLENEDDCDVISFFRNQFDRLSEKDRADQAGAALRRAHLLTFNPVLKFSLSQNENLLDTDKIEDEGISVLLGLGRIHDIEARRLLGCLLTISYEQSALSREGSGRPKTQHHLFLDEMAEFISQSEQALSRMLSQTRKYNLFTLLAHQTNSQATERLKGALQNCQVQVAFGVGREDAEEIVKAMQKLDIEAIKSEAKTETQHPVFTEATMQWEAYISHLMELPPRNALVKIRGHPVVQVVTPTIPKPRVDPRYVEEIKQEYRRRLTRRKAEISLVHQKQRGLPRQTIRFGPIHHTT